MIHPTAVVEPGVQLGKEVTVAPFAVIDRHVIVGDECWIGPHVHVTGHTTMGRGNKVHAGAVIGDAPQDLKYRDEATRLVIGDRNIFREHVTVHRSAKMDHPTTIGNDCLFMAGSHVAHNCRVGDHVILANGTLLGGHVTIHDRAFLSGNCLVHQFVTVGTLALMQGGAAISLDLPPFCVAARSNTLSGLNTIGLRRAGLSGKQRLELRHLYQVLFRRIGNLSEAIEAIDPDSLDQPGRVLLEFVRSSRRGVCPAVRDRTPPADFEAE